MSASNTLMQQQLNEDLIKKIKKAKVEYYQYASTQRSVFIPPPAKISIEKSNENRTDVHIDVSYKNINYHYESIKMEDVEDFHAYLNSQPLVRRKYAHGGVVSFQTTQERTDKFNNRFNPSKRDDCYLYSGFVVSDADTGNFLGVANLEESEKSKAYAEIAFLNRADSWSSATPDIVKEYAIPKKCKLDKRYQGVCTVEVSTLLQYAFYLKEKGHTIQGNKLEGIDATARIDNPGSWMSFAKSGFDVAEITANPNYGPELRHQLFKRIT